jgi:hypothetical protein
MAIGGKEFSERGAGLIILPQLHDRPPSYPRPSIERETASCLLLRGPAFGRGRGLAEACLVVSKRLLNAARGPGSWLRQSAITVPVRYPHC